MAMKRLPKADKVPQPPVATKDLETDYREPTEAEILASLEKGLRQALAGEGRPARELLAELLNE